LTKIFLSILFVFNSLIFFGQNNIQINWPLDSNEIYAVTFESYSNKFYTGVQNRFRIKIPNVKTRNIELVFDSSGIEIETFWRPINSKLKWNDPLSEYTLMTAKSKGAFYPEKVKIEEKYIDTNGVYWEKEYSIQPTTARQYDLTVYIIKSDSLKILHNTAIFYANHITKPTLELANLNDLLTLGTLTPIIDKDLKNGADWFRVRSYKFVTYDKNNEIIYSTKCPGDILLTSMKEAIKNKKVKYIILSNISSLNHNYKDIKLVKQ
jgi:hypothetical protein